MLRVWERQAVEVECRTAEACPTSGQGGSGATGTGNSKAAWRVGVVRLSAAFISSDLAPVAH